MGTSKGYKMPTGGDWTPLKREATDFVQSGGVEPAASRALLRDYMKVRSTSNAGHTNSSTGGTGSAGGGGGSARGWGVGIATAQKVGGFFSRVGNVGLAEALREIGLGDLVGQSAAEVSGALLDKLVGPASTLDEAAARKALVELNDELLADAETFEDVEEALANTLDEGGLFEILLRFFGYYVYECFCTDFYERFVKKVGSSRAAQSLKSIKDCIESAIKAKLAGVDVKRFSWSGSEGKAISEQVLREVQEIFEVPA